MPVTITLSDELAGELMKSITDSLTRRPPTMQPPQKQDLYAAGCEATLAHVEKMAPGDTLHVARFAARIGVPTNGVSDTVQRLKKRGEIEMVQKGTWRKCVSAIARAA